MLYARGSGLQASRAIRPRHCYLMGALEWPLTVPVWSVLCVGISLTPSRNYEREPILMRTITGAEARSSSPHALCTQVLGSAFQKPPLPAPHTNALTCSTGKGQRADIADAGLRKAVITITQGTRVGQFLRDTANSLLDNLITEGAPADLHCDFADPLATALHCRVLRHPAKAAKLFIQQYRFHEFGRPDPRREDQLGSRHRIHGRNSGKPKHHDRPHG